MLKQNKKPASIKSNSIQTSKILDLKKKFEKKLSELRCIEDELKFIEAQNIAEECFDQKIFDKLNIKCIERNAFCDQISFLQYHAVKSNFGIKENIFDNNNFYNFNNNYFLFYTHKKIPGMKYYYEIISAKYDILNYYLDFDDQNNELPIIGLAKYTLVKNKNGENIKVFVYPEDNSDINDGFVDKNILKLYLTYLDLEVYKMAEFIKKYIKEDSKKINFIDKLANKSSSNKHYGAFIFDNISYDIDKDFEDPGRFKKILKETIVNFIKNADIVSMLNKENLPFNLDFHLMMS